MINKISTFIQNYKLPSMNSNAVRTHLSIVNYLFSQLNATQFAFRNRFVNASNLNECELSNCQHDVKKSHEKSLINTYEIKDPIRFEKCFFYSLQLIQRLTYITYQSTNNETKQLLIKSLFKSSLDDQSKILKIRASIVSAYSLLYFSENECYYPLKRSLCKLVVYTPLLVLNNPHHPIHQIFSKESQVRFCCYLIHRCNIPRDSYYLKTILDYLSEVSNKPANTYYLEIASNKLGETQEKKMNSIDTYVTGLFYDLEENDIDEQSLEDPCAFFLLILRKPLNIASLKKRILMAKIISTNACEIIPYLEDRDVVILMNTICSKNGILRQLRLPLNSKTLKSVLSELDAVTKNRASLIYNKSKNILK